MPKICYQKHRFSASSEAIIKRANEILREYAAQGYDLTLRQLYYQFVARGIIPNKDKEYNRLGSIINDARLAGRIDWDHITDRTRNLKSNAHWDSPKDIVEACAKQFQFDKWSDQDNYVEVWVEKDALVGVLEVACKPLDVPYFSCRGYTSQSEMWSAGQRLLKQYKAGKRVHIIHLGDHDPSGVDMSRDIEDRLRMFLNHHVLIDHLKANPRDGDESQEQWMDRMEADDGIRNMDTINLNRIALNMDQIRQYDPPPNPAKLTDSRSSRYVEDYGDESWELDALAPDVIGDLIENAVKALRDDDKWDAAVEREEGARERLTEVAQTI